MTITNAQLVALKADILADQVLAALPHNAQSADDIANTYAIDAVPDFWVYRTRVTEDEIFEVTTPAPDNTVWDWTLYINRSQGERDGWGRMFGRRGYVNFALPNVRKGLADIFSQASGAAQRTHLLVMGRRKATRIEKILSTGPVGAGSTTTPATMGFEGHLTYNDVLSVWELP